ncbi:hypothetical protein ZOSMA_209G00100 [Zostera marina]|uniref:C2 domain-containing protein n=1 Tax=Zostera marina TaxID=29655 RepID=A0A0K9PN90_ZOSMR|nr:hypothetical protein ZOSMA_209G00100 [Zostera marina]
MNHIIEEIGKISNTLSHSHFSSITYSKVLKVKVIRGVKLVVRDCVASDPYLIVRHNNHKLKTRVVKRCVNPQWNEELTLSIVDANQKIKIEVFDWDKFSFDDPMGVAKIDVQSQC